MLATLIRVEPLPDGTLKALLEGKQRVRVVRFISDAEFFAAEAESLAESRSAGGIEKLLELVASAFVGGRYKSLAVNQSIFLSANGDPSVISDRIASHLPMDIREKQVLLETKDPAERLRRILAYLNASDSRASDARD